MKNTRFIEVNHHPRVNCLHVGCHRHSMFGAGCCGEPRWDVSALRPLWLVKPCVFGSGISGFDLVSNQNPPAHAFPSQTWGLHGKKQIHVHSLKIFKAICNVQNTEAWLRPRGLLPGARHVQVPLRGKGRRVRGARGVSRKSPWRRVTSNGGSMWIQVGFHDLP